MKILVLGGYGVFGGRLIDLVADVNAFEILVCGRSADKAEAFCARRQSGARLVPLRLDRSDVDLALQQQRPDVLVDASGPFQDYGDDRYSVVESCIRQRVNYLDFADGSEFVSGIDQFNEAAQRAGVFVLSGVSSFPVLTAAVIDELQHGMDIHKVTAGIAPSPYAGVGMNVMRAVLGYAGGPVRLTRAGKLTAVGGLTESLRYTVSPPGYLPLRNLRFSLVDVPDLRVIPQVFPQIRDIWVGAGPVPEFLHRLLNLIAKIRSAWYLPSLAPFAGVCYWVINHLRYGEHRGGMFVEVEGQVAGKVDSGETGEAHSDQQRGFEKRSWHLLAEGDDGPYIPSMAIEILLRKLENGDAPDAGARPAIATLTLQDYERVFAGRQIYSGIRRPPAPQDNLFAAVLGDKFAALPKSVREFHEVTGSSEWVGPATVTAASGLLARLIARLFRFPTRTQQTSVRVLVQRSAEREHWTRSFGTAEFHSTLTAGSGREEQLICEKMGLATIALAIVLDGESLQFLPRRWRIGPLPLPRFLLPGGNSFEREADGQFVFDVKLELPVIGLLVAYQGTLARASD
ncbi:MAG: DUF4166 domain-containing protein [Woeseia sp.]